MTLSYDHLISFTLSVALHLLGMLLLGRAATQHAEEHADIAPELQLTSVQLTLSEVEAAAPGAPSAPAQPEVPPLALPEPEPLPPQELPEKPDFTEVLPEPLPEPMPEPVVEPPPLPAPEPQPEPPPEPPPPAPEPPPEPPKPQPAPPAPQPVTTEPTPPTPPPSVESDGAIGDGGAAGRVDAQPSLDYAIRPVYPLGARQRGEEGSVVLDVKVAANGRASGVTLVTSSGFPALDRAAERAAAQARFNPAMRGGRPVESTARLTLVFRLRDL